MRAILACALLGSLAGLPACAAHGDPPRGPASATGAYAAAESAAPSARPTTSAPAPEAHGLLTLHEARAYMVKLVNRDRASMGLPPVTLDEGPASRAGQAHADDMASRGYLGHWGSDGSVPEQRYTEAGGTDMVLENASCFTDEKTRTLDPNAKIDPKEIEAAEDMFFHEQPPHDGHRKNILKPWHKLVGIGISQPVATPTEIPVPCVAQEFVDAYGSYSAVPRKMHVGETLHVEGTMTAPAKFAGVGLARVEAPKPIPTPELNRRRSYPVPAPYQMYWPPGFVTPIPVTVQGSKFSIDVPVGERNKPGLYEVSAWATLPGTSDFVMVSLRTMVVK